MKNELLVLPHLEIGDQIIQNGACRVLAHQHEKGAWAARHDNIEFVRWMLSDLGNVRVVEINEYNYARSLVKLDQAWKDCKRVGFFTDAGLGIGTKANNWDEVFYENLGVNFTERWTRFALPDIGTPADVQQEGHPFALAHECANRGYTINRKRLDPTMPHVFVDMQHPFRMWLGSVLGATELHFVDSAFLNLAESLYGIGFLRNTKLYFHEYAKLGQPPTLRAPWNRLQ